MGLFSSLFGKEPEMKYRDPLKGMEFTRGLVSEELKGLPGAARGVSERMAAYAGPTMGRWSQMLEEGGPTWGPEEQEAIGGYRGMLEARPGQFMGGYDPEAAKRAITSAYEEDAPEAIRRVMTQAGMQAPGIHRGRVREEAGRAAGSLYDEMQRALAEENVRRAQLQAGAEQFAAGERFRGAGGLRGFRASDLMQQEAQMLQALQGWTSAPEAMRQQLTQRMFSFDPRTYAMQAYMEPGEPGLLSKIGGAMSSFAPIASMIPGVGSAIGGFTSLMGQGGGGATTMEYNPSQFGGYSQYWPTG